MRHTGGVKQYMPNPEQPGLRFMLLAGANGVLAYLSKQRQHLRPPARRQGNSEPLSEAYPSMHPVICSGRSPSSTAVEL